MDTASKEKELKLYDYILYFFIYSFLGWVLETAFSYFVLGHFVNRGFLTGPICPIYGFGMLIIIIPLSKYKNSNIKLFVVSAVVLSIFEYITSYVLDATFGLKWWDYTSDFLNINGRIAAFYTIAWGFITLFAINFIHPIIKKFSNFLKEKMPQLAFNIILRILTITLIIDFVLSVLDYILK